MKKNIVLLYETFTFGGLENYMLSVRRMCREEGLECWLVSLQKSHQADVVSLSEDEFLNVRFPLYAYSLFKLLRDLKPAVVHSQSYYSYVLSSFLGGALGYQTICTIHNPFPVTVKPGPLQRLLPNLLTLDVLIGVSQQSLDETLNCFNIRAKEKIVIHNWVDTNRFSVTEEKVPHQILFVGRLDSQKKIETLPGLIQSLRHDMPQLVLHVCGDGPLAHIIEGVDGIVLHGKVDNETLVRLLQESALLVLPTRFEGMPLVILESLACGTPVVASPVGGIPEIADTSYGCFVADDEDFSDVVRRSLQDDIDYMRIRNEAIERFSYQRGKKELISIYRRLLETS